MILFLGLLRDFAVLPVADLAIIAAATDIGVLFQVGAQNVDIGMRSGGAQIPLASFCANCSLVAKMAALTCGGLM